MSKRLVTVEVGKKQILAEVDVKAGEEQVAGGIADVFSFESVSDGIKAISEEVARALQTVAPREAKVEFSISLSAKSGKLLACLVDSSASAAVKVTLTWGGKPEAAKQ